MARRSTAAALASLAAFAVGAARAVDAAGFPFECDVKDAVLLDTSTVPVSIIELDAATANARCSDPYVTYTPYVLNSDAFRQAYGMVNQDAMIVLPTLAVFTNGDLLCYCECGYDVGTYPAPIKNFTAVKGDIEGAETVTYELSDSQVIVTYITTETSPYWKWKTGEPDVVYADSIVDACKPAATFSGLHRPTWDTELADADAEGWTSEYSTEKPGWNVNKLVIDIESNVGGVITGSGTHTTYFPGMNGEDAVKGSCDNVVVTIKTTQHGNSNYASQSGAEAFLSETLAQADGKLERCGPFFAEMIDITDSEGEQLYMFTMNRNNNREISGDGVYTPAGFLTGVSEFTSVVKQVPSEHQQILDNLANAVVGTCASVASSGASELQGKDEDGDKYPGLMTLPNSPGPFGWNPYNPLKFEGHPPNPDGLWNNLHDGNHIPNVFAGIGIDDLNCESDGFLFQWLSHSAIYTQSSTTSSYAWNDLWVKENNDQMGLKMGNGHGHTYYNWPGRFAWTQNEPAGPHWSHASRTITLCPGTTNELRCSPVHFTHYGPVRDTWNYQQREIKCVRTLPDTTYGQRLAQWNASKTAYEKCPHLNPLGANPPKAKTTEEVFVVISGSIGTADGGDFFGTGGNVCAKPDASEAQYFPKGCFDTKGVAEVAASVIKAGAVVLVAKFAALGWAIGLTAPVLAIAGLATQFAVWNSVFTGDCSVKVKKTPALLKDSERRGAGPNHNKHPGAPAWLTTSPVSLLAESDMSKVQILTSHMGVKLETNIHRDRAWLEKLYISDTTGEPYERITYVGHSRGGAKVNYMGHRHKTLWPSHNVRIISAGTMGSSRGYHVRLDSDGKWKRFKGHGSVYAQIPKTLAVNQAQKCGSGKARQDFAPNILSAFNFHNDHSLFKHLVNARHCEKKLHKYDSSNKVSYKIWFDTDLIYGAHGTLPLHFEYGAYPYLARGFDKFYL